MFDFSYPGSFGRRFINPAAVASVCVTNYPDVGVRIDLVGRNDYFVRCESKEEAERLLDRVLADMGAAG